MKNKGLYLVAALLFILSLVVGWFLHNIILETFFEHYGNTGFRFVYPELAGQFKQQLFTTLSFSLPALLSWALVVLLNKYKNRQPSYSLFFKSFSISLFAFVIGIVAWFFIFHLQLDNVAKYSMSPVSQVNIFDNNFLFTKIATIIAPLITILIYILTKKQIK